MKQATKTAASPALKKKFLVLLIATVVTSILHYVDNVVFFHLYPEPVWLKAQVVDVFWFIMTTVGVAGYLLWHRGAKRLGITALVAYCMMNMLSLGHYLYAAPWDISFRINLFIWVEVFAATLLLFAVVLTARARME